MSIVSVVTPLPVIPATRQILLVNKDSEVQHCLRQLLEMEGYDVATARSGSAALKALEVTPPSMVLVDACSTDVSSHDLVARIRLICPTLPILILGTQSSVAEKVQFLELGADDYIVIPFSDRELVARVRSALRWAARRDSANVFAFADAMVNIPGMEISRAGKPVFMTSMEFNILKFMIQNPDRVISRDELLNAVWGYHNYPTTRTVDNHILKLRQKLEPDPAHPKHFRTVRGIGYRFTP